MRRLLVLFMICLLPLRSWAGDLMGIQMSLLETVGTVSAQAAPHMPPNCLMHASSVEAAIETASEPGEDGQPAAGPSDGCNACDLCLPIAQVAAAPASVGDFAGHVQCASRGPASLNAAPAPTIKPPIS